MLACTTDEMTDVNGGQWMEIAKDAIMAYVFGEAAGGAYEGVRGKSIYDDAKDLARNALGSVKNAIGSIDRNYRNTWGDSDCGAGRLYRQPHRWQSL